MERKTETRAAYPHFLAVPTRWMDNDVYGHVNNVVYYSYFDTVVNRYLIDQGVLDIQNSPVIGLVVTTNCHYFAPIAFPQDVEAGLRVVHIGNSSVRYEIGLFTRDSATPAAVGQFTHVYVNRASNRPGPLPAELRAALEKILTHPKS
jgi:acyl-CoA thioester hydrolase